LRLLLRRRCRGLREQKNAGEHRTRRDDAQNQTLVVVHGLCELTFEPSSVRPKDFLAEVISVHEHGRRSVATRRHEHVITVNGHDSDELALVVDEIALLHGALLAVTSPRCESKFWERRTRGVSAPSYRHGTSR
jgi:hypothetical protein